MGGGIAQVAADAGRRAGAAEGHPAGGARQRPRHAAELFAKQVERRRLTRRRRAEDGAAPADARLPRARARRPGDRGGGREARGQAARVRRGGAQARPETVLATNTSSLSIDAIAPRHAGAGARRRHALLQPGAPHAARRGGASAGAPRPAAAATVAAFARRLGKTPVLVQDGPGFLVNRLLAFYMAEAMGSSPRARDRGHRPRDGRLGDADGAGGAHRRGRPRRRRAR